MTSPVVLLAKTPAEVDRAVETAHRACLAAAAAEPATRADWLDRIAEALAAAGDELVALAVAETNLTEPRLRTELTRSAFQLRLLAEDVRSGTVLDATIDHADPDWGMGPRPDLRRVNVPLGVVGVFGASNFPFAFSVMGGDSASALAAGCAVVHKIHPGHPRLGARTAELVIDALERGGAPGGIFAAVEGQEAALALVDHLLLRAVAFTGSTTGGRALFDRVCARPEPIPFYGELGSINPVFVLPAAWQARRDEILAGFAASFTMGMGQFCTKPGVLVVPDTMEGDLDQRLAHALADAPGGRMLTPGLREGYLAARDEVTGLPGVVTVLPGSDEEIPAPTVLSVSADQALRTPEVLRREMFGPATMIVRYRDEGQLHRLASELEGQLTATIHAEDADDAALLRDVLTTKAGRVLWNGWPTGVTVSYAQQHGGPYPATTAPGTTSVGTAAARRFVRPVAYQGFPDAELPPSLQEANPWHIARRVDGRFEPADGPSGREGRDR